jgi:hypothetical protein
MSTPVTEPAVTSEYAYRVEQFEGMGFTTGEAKKLADAKDEKDVPIYPPKVKAAIDAGCKHVTAVQIFT